MISINNVSKIYNEKKKNQHIAIKDLSLEISDGSIVGLIGPNGAGKSTLIKLILGIMYPTKGSIEINNKNTFKYRKKLMKEIGIVFGQRSQLWWDLPPIDSYNLIQKIYEVDNEKYLNTINEMVELLEINSIINTPVRYLSLGQRMKCEIVAALCFSPKIIVLDEPTIGLDISAKDSIRKFLKHINKTQGVTIILATHDLTDVEAICERVIMINHGELVYDGDSKNIITTKNSLIKSEIIVSSDISNCTFPFECDVSTTGEQKIINISGDSSKIINSINWCLSKFNVEDISIIKPGIDEILMEWYKK